MFSDFTTPDGVPSWDALLEQGILFQALTFNDLVRRDEAISICGGGLVLHWDWGTGSWPPSISMIRQGNVITILVTGTENLSQLYGDIIGAYATPYATFGCKVHVFFQQAWGSVRDRLAGSLPVDWRSCEFRFFGHSLGAAVAFLGALEWKRNNPGIRVKLLTTAMPKALTIGYNDSLPDTCNFVASPFDIVPLVPMNGMNVAAFFLNPIVFWSIPWNWVHYATGWFMDGGVLPLRVGTADDFNYTPNPIIVATTTIEHFFSSYLGNILRGFQTYRNVGQDVALYPLARYFAGAPALQTLVNNIDASQYIDVPAQNLLSFESTGPGPLTDANLRSVESINSHVDSITRDDAIFSGLLPGGNMGAKVTVFMHDGAGAFTESYFRTGLDPTSVTPAMLIALTDARVKLGGVEFGIDKIRVSTVGNSRQVALWYRAALFTAAGGVHRWTGSAGLAGHASGIDADFAGTSLLCRKQSGLKFSRLFLRGIPDAIVLQGGKYWPTAVPGFEADLAAFGAVLASGWSWLGVSGTQPAPQAVTAAVTGTDSLCLITVAGPLFTGKAAGTKIVVRISGQRQPANLNGNFTVSVVSDTQCRTVSPLSINNFTVSNGRMRFTNVDYIPITSVKAERIVSKRPGRPTDQYRGRSRNVVRG